MDNTILHLGSYHLPTATFFDLGVMMIVVGTLMTIFVELAMERR
jgi:multicomponent Na+:H+ antiporter subunit B